MLKRCVFASCALGALVLGSAYLDSETTASFAFGEARIIPDTSFYFDNFRFDRYPYATVVDVVAGDIVVVQIEGELTLRYIKLAGIQALDPTEQPFFGQAVELLREMILFERVKLEGDKFLRNEDATGFIEAYVWQEGRLMNAALVRNGLAVVIPYSHNIKYDNYFSGLQERARNEQLGVWAL